MRIKNDYNFGDVSSLVLDDEGVGIYTYSFGKTGVIPYKDIYSFNVIVHTMTRTYKGSKTTQISSINIYVNGAVTKQRKEIGLIGNDKDMYLISNKGNTTTKYENKMYHVTNNGNINTLYEILNYKKYIGNFKLRIDGPMGDIGTVLKIYSRTGIKISPQNNPLSIPAFIITCVVGYALYTDVFNQRIFDVYNAFINLFWEMLIFYIVAFVLSAIVVYNEYKKFKIRRMLNL